MDKSKFVIGIQARINSTRFPRKCFAKWNGDDMWYHVYKTAASTGIDTVMLVPGTDQELINDMRDRPIPIKYLTGPEESPLERFRILEMNSQKTTYIIRITADCPLLTREMIMDVANFASRDWFGYVGNELDGMDIQIFSPYLLYQEMFTDHEHVINIPAIKKYGLFTKWEMHWSVDTPEQYEYLKEIGGINE